MKIFALESSDAKASVAVAEDERILCDLRLDLGLRHSETLQAAADHALELAGIDYSDIDLFACTAGPGSYTGLRIGLTAAKCMAFACDKSIYTVDSLSAMAVLPPLPEGELIFCMLDARNRRVFSSLCTAACQDILLPPHAGDFDERAEQVCARAQALGAHALHLAGPCAARYAADPDFRAILQSHGLSCGLIFPDGPLAAAVALLAARAGDDRTIGRITSAQDALPIYLSATQAERNSGYYV